MVERYQVVVTYQESLEDLAGQVIGVLEGLGYRCLRRLAYSTEPIPCDVNIVIAHGSEDNSNREFIAKVTVDETWEVMNTPAHLAQDLWLEDNGLIYSVCYSNFEDFSSFADRAGMPRWIIGHNTAAIDNFVPGDLELVIRALFVPPLLPAVEARIAFDRVVPDTTNDWEWIAPQG